MLYLPYDSLPLKNTKPEEDKNDLWSGKYLPIPLLPIWFSFSTTNKN